jgi:hypothetical protein
MSAILNHLIKDHGVSMAEAKAALAGWNIQPLMHNGIQVGEVMLKANEVHIALDEPYRLQMGRRTFIENSINELLKKHEFLVTKLFKGDKLKKLLEFIGFREIKADEKYHYFWLDEETRDACA